MKKTYIKYGDKEIPFFVHDRILTNHGTMEDYISEMVSESHEFFELDFLEYLAEDWGSPLEGRFLDVGAHIGNHSVYAKEVMGFKKVTCIEPYKPNIACLEGNCPWADIIRAGASDKEGEMGYEMGYMEEPRQGRGMYLGNAGGVSLKEGSGISTVTVDSLGLSELDLVKIDVEGMEVQVAKGASETFARCKPEIWAEIKFIENVAPFFRALPPGYVMTDAFVGKQDTMYKFEYL